MIHLPFYSVNGPGEFTFLFKKDFDEFSLEPFYFISSCYPLQSLFICISLCVKKGCTVSYTYEVFFARLFFSVSIFSFFRGLQILHAITALKFPHVQVWSVP